MLVWIKERDKKKYKSLWNSKQSFHGMVKYIALASWVSIIKVGIFMVAPLTHGDPITTLSHTYSTWVLRITNIMLSICNDGIGQEAMWTVERCAHWHNLFCARSLVQGCAISSVQGCAISSVQGCAKALCKPSAFTSVNCTPLWINLLLDSFNFGTFPVLTNFSLSHKSRTTFDPSVPCEETQD